MKKSTVAILTGAGVVVASLALILVWPMLPWVHGPVQPPKPVARIQMNWGAFFVGCNNGGILIIDVEGLFWDNKPECSDDTIHTDVSHEEMDHFLATMTDIGVYGWKEHYDDWNIMDGWGFLLTITYDDGTQQTTEGNNKYPPTWDKFRAALEDFGILLR